MLKFTIGADISKDKINFALLHDNQFLFDKEVKNTTTELNKFVKEVSSLLKSISKKENATFEVEYIMEYTGIYNNLLVECLLGHKITTYIVSGLAIKNSQGISRGKNDKIDARRIADYGVRYNDKLIPFTMCSDVLKKLKALKTKRAQLVKVKAQLVQSNTDSKKFLGKEINNTLSSSTKLVIDELTKSIKTLDDLMMKLIKSDKEIFDNYKLAVSVPGVGKVIAITLISASVNFTKFSSAKALGTYCGVVPFGSESGNKKGKDRVSHLANKKLKTLLHLGALSAVNGKNAYADYYQKKITVDKKNKMLALNNVRNKMLKTVFACIKSKTKYQIDYCYQHAV
ncbi:MAG: transposase [Cyclobacteriaceae bacterium]